MLEKTLEKKVMVAVLRKTNRFFDNNFLRFLTTNDKLSENQKIETTSPSGEQVLYFSHYESLNNFSVVRLIDFWTKEDTKTQRKIESFKKQITNNEKKIEELANEYNEYSRKELISLLNPELKKALDEHLILDGKLVLKQTLT